MDAWRQVQQAMAAQRLGWQDIWKVTVDRRDGWVVLITTDGRKFRHPLRPATPARTKLVKRVTDDE